VADVLKKMKIQSKLSGGCPKVFCGVADVLKLFLWSGGFPKEDEDSIKMHRTSLQKVFSAKLRRILREREQIFSNSARNPSLKSISASGMKTCTFFRF